MSAKIRTCRVCGCTDDDCHQCIEKTGFACHWVEDDLCSACKLTPYLFTIIVCKRLDVREDFVKSYLRREDIVRVRTAIIRTLIKHFKLTLMQVGALLVRDHSSVIHARDKYHKNRDKQILQEQTDDQVENIYLDLTINKNGKEEKGL